MKALLIVLLLMSASFVAVGSPFDDLPPLPEDFWAKKSLFDTQQIPASRLTSEYYLRPELYPAWDYCYNKSYLNRTRVGSYGINAYPSRFDIFMSNNTESFEVSFLLYTGFGVEIYQGAKIVPHHDDNVTIRLVSPENDTYLLTPTYPSFTPTWSRVVVYSITATVVNESIVDLMEETPDEEYDTLWSEQYNLYTSGGSVLGLKVPKVRIYLHGVGLTPPPVEKEVAPNNNWVGVLLLIAIISVAVIYGIRKRKTRTKKDKTT